MKKVIVVGAGAGGATVAKELQGHFHVTLIESGNDFKPFSISLPYLEKLRYTNLFLTEKMIQGIFPAYRITKTPEMVLVSGRGIGGTTRLSCGNALRVDHGLRKIGINLDDEFSSLGKEIPITCDHEHLWRASTRKLFEICKSKGLNPFAVPKAGNYKDCRNCGQCTLGCRYGVKWDSSKFVQAAREKGCEVINGCRVKKLVTENSHSEGVMTDRGFMRSDYVVIAAGGFNTPVILNNSGIKTSDTLFVDPVLCVAAEYPGAFQNKEMPMPFAVQMDGYIISPYFDYLSFFFNKNWKKPAKNILSLMIKLADSEEGNLKRKLLTNRDNERLKSAADLCKEIFSEFGIRPGNTFMGTLNAGHPGGMFPLTEDEAQSLHNPSLPNNVYVADASLFPSSLGNPPILTIMALGKRISRIIKEQS
jgi:choline dehydrogenase-like flavoprotein